MVKGTDHEGDDIAGT